MINPDLGTSAQSRLGGAGCGSRGMAANSAQKN
jgi:hypothetical protein